MTDIPTIYPPGGPAKPLPGNASTQQMVWAINSQARQIYTILLALSALQPQVNALPTSGTADISALESAYLQTQANITTLMSQMAALQAQVNPPPSALKRAAAAFMRWAR